MLARLKSKILHAVGYRKKIDMRVCTINKVDDLIPDSIGEGVWDQINPIGDIYTGGLE